MDNRLLILFASLLALSALASSEKPVDDQTAYMAPAINQLPGIAYNQFSISQPNPVSGVCGTALNACKAGTLNDTEDDAVYYFWKCMGLYGGSTSSCKLEKPVNGTCGTTKNSCVTGTIKDRTDDSEYYLWKCMGLYGGSTSSCSLPKPVSGVCGTALNACKAGTLNDTEDDAVYYFWKCMGLYGGSTSSCRLEKPVNGTCGTTKNSCVTGTVKDIASDSEYYLWKCMGLYGGSTSSCRLKRTPECSNDSGCDRLDKDYCQDTAIMHDEGVCVSGACASQASFVENCNGRDSRGCNGTTLFWQAYGCQGASCLVTSSGRTECAAECGAECDSAADCDDKNANTADTCGSNCTCAHAGIVNPYGLKFLSETSTSSGPDDDGDGVNDWWETAYNYSTSDKTTPSSAIDSDSDGVNDYNEGIQGTNPKVADSFAIMTVAIAYPNIIMSMNTFYGNNYTIEGATSLMSPNWTEVAQFYGANATSTTVSAPMNGPVSYYRAAAHNVANTCVPNWIAQYGDCLRNDSKVKYYTDSKSCGTSAGLPADNGTYLYCDYGLMFYEPFENQSTLTANGCTSCIVSSFVPGKLGNAAYFTSGSMLKYPIAGRLNYSSGTVSFWVKPNSMSVSGGLFDYGEIGSSSYFGVFKPSWNGIYMEYRNNGAPIYGGQIQNSNSLNESNWTNVVLVWKTGPSGYFSEYVNGRLVGTQPYGYSGFTPTENYFSVGRSGFYYAANAYIDEFRVYSYRKVPEEVAAEYAGLSYNPPADQTGGKKPQSTGPVQVNSSGLFVNGSKFIAKGVGYQPIPIGKTATLISDKQAMYNDARIYRDRDFPLLRSMGANTVRTWSEVLNTSFMDVAWNNGAQPIYVVMGFWIDCNVDYTNPSIRQTYINKFKTYVTTYKDKPSVLMWGLGNENNLAYCLGSQDLKSYYSLCNDLAKAAYEVEGASYHPVAIVNGDIGGLGLPEFYSDDAHLNYTDLWGANHYPERYFGGWFDAYRNLSVKPVIITEYGIDALNSTANYTEYESVQAQWDRDQWRGIANSSIAVGGTLMAYSDEWWKAGNLTGHNNGGYGTTNLRQPDSYSNEEWWGVMRTVKNGTSTDIMQPRQVYYTLQSEWAS